MKIFIDIICISNIKYIFVFSNIAKEICLHNLILLVLINKILKPRQKEQISSSSVLFLQKVQLLVIKFLKLCF